MGAPHDIPHMEAWAADITHQVHAKWLEYQTYVPNGYRVFYGPVVRKGGLMIIGFNPGGDKSTFQERLVPTTHEYLWESYAIARRMRDILGVEAIEKSVKLNRIFFKTRSMKEWQAVEKTKRKELDVYCRDVVKTIVERIEPEIIIVEGFASYTLLSNELALGVHKERWVCNANGRRLMVFRGKCVGIIHPSGARLSKADVTLIKATLGEFIKASKFSRVPS